jgi:hypothetical protein
MDEFLTPEEIAELSERKKSKSPYLDLDSYNQDRFYNAENDSYGFFDPEIKKVKSELKDVTSSQKENPEFARGYDQRLIDLSKKLDQLKGVKTSVDYANSMRPKTDISDLMPKRSSGIDDVPLMHSSEKTQDLNLSDSISRNSSELPDFLSVSPKSESLKQSAYSLPKDNLSDVIPKNYSEMPDFLSSLPKSEVMPGVSKASMSRSMSASVPVARSIPSEEKQMQDVVDLEKQQGADYAKRLEEAERKARENEALGLAAKAISQIAGGIAQTKAKADLGKVDTSVAEEFLKSAGKPIEELKRSIEMEKDDPNSAASKSLRQIAQSELKSVGMSLDLGNMSYNQIKNIFPEISRRAERLETAKLRQQQAAELRQQREELKAEKEESKKTAEQNRFLERSQTKFERQPEHKALFILRDAVEQIDDYLRNPTAMKAESLKYTFPKINDPNSVVRESELKLFGKAGSVTDKFRNEIEQILSGTIRPEKAKQFRDFVVSKMKSNERTLKTQLTPYIEQGKRYGLDEQDIVSNVAGPEYYKNLFKGTQMSDAERKELMELRKLQQK